MLGMQPKSTIRRRRRDRPVQRLVYQELERLVVSKDLDLDDEASTRRAGDVVLAGIGEAGTSLAGVLLDRAPEMLAEHRAIRAGFESRLQTTWGPAFDLMETVTVVSFEIGEELARDGRERRVGGPRREALLRIHVWACLVTDEIYSLLRSGHLSGAMARWRSLHELAVVAWFLKGESTETAERYLLHHEAMEARDLEAYQTFASRLPIDPVPERQVRDAQRRRAELKLRFGPDYGESDYDWAVVNGNRRPKLTDLQKAVDLDHWRPYVRLAHRSIHSGSAGLYGDIGVMDPHKMMLAGPSNTGLGEPAQGAIIALNNVTAALVMLDGADFDGIYWLRALGDLVDRALEAFANVEASSSSRWRGRPARGPPDWSQADVVGRNAYYGRSRRSGEPPLTGRPGGCPRWCCIQFPAFPVGTVDAITHDGRG